MNLNNLFYMNGMFCEKDLIVHITQWKCGIYEYIGDIKWYILDTQSYIQVIKSYIQDTRSYIQVIKLYIRDTKLYI